MPTPAAQPVPQKLNFAEILAGLARPGAWNIPSAGGTTIPFLPQPAAGTESPFLYLAPPEPINQVVRMPISAPPVTAVAPPVAPIMPSAYGANVSVSGIPKVNIPDVTIPPEPTMPAGMTLEQAIAMGSALAPNVNLQPLTRQDILGTEDPRSLIGLLPEHVKQLMDTRTGLRASKAAEDAAAVALAKQTQGLDVAQDIAKDIPKQQQARDIAQYGAKAAEKLTAQKAKYDRDTEQTKLDAGRLKALYEVSRQPINYTEMLNQEKSRILLLSGQPGGESQITAAQARMAGIVERMSDAEAATYIRDYATSLGLLPPDMQAKMALPPDMMANLMIKAKRSVSDVTPSATGVTFTPKPGGK